MSVDVGSMPPWKRELLERKRRQEEDERKRHGDEFDRMTNLPSWKRDLMLKKQKQKNTFVFLSKSGEPVTEGEKSPRAEMPPVNGDSDGHVSVTVAPSSPKLTAGRDTTTEYDTSYVTGGDTINGEAGEHLIPIQCNPWLKLDTQRRASRHSSSKLSDSSVMANDSIPRHSHVSSNSSHNSTSLETERLPTETKEPSPDKDNDTDSVFGEEEVTYGRGFVNKLLRKFKHITAKDDHIQNYQHKTSPKRTLSSDNILDERRSSLKGSPKHHLSVGDNLDGFSSLSNKQKAVSVDNLLVRTKFNSYDSLEHLSGSEENLVADSTGITLISSRDDSISNLDPHHGSFELRRSSSHENVLEEAVPRPNIVSAARSVFESMSTRAPSPVYKKRHSPDPPGRSSSSSNSSHGGSITSPNIMSSSTSPSLSAMVEEKNLSNLNYKGNNNSDRSSNKLQTGMPDRTSNRETKKDKYNNTGTVDNRARSSMIFNSVNPDTLVDKQDDINANEADKPDLRTGSSGATLTSYHGNSDNYTTQNKTRNSSSFGTVSASVPVTQVKSDYKHRDRYTNHTSESRTTTTTQEITQAANHESSATSEAITLENQSAKEVNDNSPSAESTKVEDKSSDRKSSSESSLLRNTEANRLHLNLNLNELNRKKGTTETPTTSSNVDINRNNKNITSSTSSAPSSTLSSSLSSSTRPVSSAVSSYSSSSSSVTSTSSSTAKPTVVQSNISNNNTVKLRKKKKGPAPTGPGSLLMRPASNLVAAGTKTEFLTLNKYNDIKDGEFAPAKKRPSYYDDSDDEDVPSTNIDDYLNEDMPVTNIDDVSPSGTPREGDPSKHRNVRNVKKIEFLGAGVLLDRSLLKKTRSKKVRLNFPAEESIRSVFEYPSEQFLLRTMVPEPGDFDYRDPNAPEKPATAANQEAARNGSVSDEDPPDYVEPSGLKSTPGVGSTGSLGSYQSKVQVDYFFGMEKETTESKAPERQAPSQESVDVKPSEEDDFTWSDATTSDMLF